MLKQSLELSFIIDGMPSVKENAERDAGRLDNAQKV
jgi:hypothetical protein